MNMLLAPMTDVVRNVYLAILRDGGRYVIKDGTIWHHFKNGVIRESIWTA